MVNLGKLPLPALPHRDILGWKAQLENDLEEYRLAPGLAEEPDSRYLAEVEEALLVLINWVLP